MSDQFNHHNEDRRKMGELYLETEAKYGENVSITFLDPRNIFAIIIYFFQHARRGNISLREAVVHVFMHVKFNAIFVNGYYVKDKENYNRYLKYAVAQREGQG